MVPIVVYLLQLHHAKKRGASASEDLRIKRIKIQLSFLLLVGKNRIIFIMTAIINRGATELLTDKNFQSNGIAESLFTEDLGITSESVKENDTIL